MPGGITMRDTRGIVAALLCLLFWTTPAYPQANSWDQSMAAGMRAYQQGCFGEARLNFLDALQEAEKLGLQHPRRGPSLYGLAEVYRAQRRYAEAELLYQRALAIREKVFGPEDRKVGISDDVVIGLSARGATPMSIFPVVEGESG
jgi:tetratricopeptide (TPR) repeat protein